MIKKKFLYLVQLITLPLALLGSSCAAQDITIAKNGCSDYSIVLPLSPSKNEQAAADLLKKTVKEATGIELPLLNEQSYKGDKGIYIGKVKAIPAAKLGQVRDDGFCIVSDKENIFIAGKSGRSTESGIYYFLEQYVGCRKYDKQKAFVPAVKELTIPANVNLVSNPSFVYRQSYYPMSYDVEYLRWHSLHLFEDLWGLWGHSFFKLLPPAQYLAAHPEYYALVNGQRKPTQLCLSNPDVLRISIGKLKQMMSDNPDALYWSVSPNDGGGNCRCPYCKKADEQEGSASGSLIRFVNKVGAAFPDKTITTLAYGYTSKAPSQTKPAGNVVVLLSTIDALREQPLQQAPSAAGFRKDLEDWGNSCKQLFIWDYATQFTNYLSPFPRLTHIAADFSYLKEKKVTGIFEQGSGDTYGDMAELNSYVQAKLLWNDQLNTDQVVQEFCTGYYGAAGSFIKEYLDLRYKTLAGSGRHLDIYGNPIMDIKSMLSAESMSAYYALLDKAEKVAADPVLKERVQRVRLSLDYVSLQQSRHYGQEKGGFLQAADKTAFYTVKPEWKKMVNDFTVAAKKAGVTELSEGGMTPDQYQQEWNRIFTRSWPVNLFYDAKTNLQYNFAEDYPAKGNHTLADGMSGFSDFSYNWLCFYGTDMVATLDAGRPVSFSTISMNFLDDPRHWIFPPSSIAVSVSEDGINFEVVGEQNIPLGKAHEDVVIRPFSFKYKGKARFLKVTAHNLKALPEWRNEGNKKPMLACDEIYVLP